MGIHEDMAEAQDLADRVYRWGARVQGEMDQGDDQAYGFVVVRVTSAGAASTLLASPDGSLRVLLAGLRAMASAL